MTIEQTSQLIQLILNSVLMVVACGVVLATLLLRYTALRQRLSSLHREYVTGGQDDPEGFSGDRRKHLKNQLLCLRRQQQIAYISVVLLHGAMMSFVVSSLLLSLRTLWGWGGLIQGALVLFVSGIVVLLLGVVVALADFHQSRRSLREELAWILAPLRDSVGSPSAKPVPRRSPPLSPPLRQLPAHWDTASSRVGTDG